MKYIINVSSLTFAIHQTLSHTLKKRFTIHTCIKKQTPSIRDNNNEKKTNPNTFVYKLDFPRRFATQCSCQYGIMKSIESLLFVGVGVAVAAYGQR